MRLQIAGDIVQNVQADASRRPRLQQPMHKGHRVAKLLTRAHDVYEAQANVVPAGHAKKVTYVVAVRRAILAVSRLPEGSTRLESSESVSLSGRHDLGLSAYGSCLQMICGRQSCELHFGCTGESLL